jgi:hypothetical protein
MTAARAPRPSPAGTRPNSCSMRSGWSYVGAPGEDASAAGGRSAPGRPNGGKRGRPTTAAPPPSPAPKSGSGYMCAPGSPTDRSTRSPPPTCAAGKRSWPGTSGRQRWPTAARWHCGSSSSPWTRAQSTPTRSARCPRPGAESILSRSLARLSGGPSLRRRPGGCWLVSRCSGGTTCSVCSAPAYALASWPGCADAGSTSTVPSRCWRSAPPAIRPAASAAASSHAPRATPASAPCPWPRWSSRPSTADSPQATTPTIWCSPAPAAAPASAAVGRACPEAPGRCCPATTSTGPTRAP